ncbi:MAG: hypothetical protein M3547_15620, partial [Acidobacteriota bacterium]|nr:hypothetical protein [Acidobacteriota bacterium]
MAGIAREHAADGIRCNAVLPKMIDTPANRASMPPEQHAGLTPPAEIAAVIRFLCGPATGPTSGAASRPAATPAAPPIAAPCTAPFFATARFRVRGLVAAEWKGVVHAGRIDDERVDVVRIDASLAHGRDRAIRSHLILEQRC